jgi:hypothetical protein
VGAGVLIEVQRRELAEGLGHPGLLLGAGRVAAKGGLAQFLQRQLAGVGERQHRVRADRQPAVAGADAITHAPRPSSARRDAQH